ncbi:TlpA family protein disulfide reductase [Tenacibaculum sp. S7007]|uniref:TlpA family protein disulfide reductase n=1 Tax=Tenacibaculum pelagium TaxID=2759527 RepID=A0A839AN69_9FLAO|nr:TlpA disulfide reductase family protein [Tenacibaculum pelagium]MBA6155649.1 TlpA family protein disulfide reductase [Tenacibaculum pelagium]
MKKSVIVLFVGLLLLNCSVKNETEFSKEALNDVFISMNNDETTFSEILSENKGKKILIDVWASWCTDCLQSLPDVKKIQEENPEISYVFLSLDRDLESWKAGVERLKIKGQHYFMQSGWKGAFGNFLGLNWIPRYLVIDEQGKIVVFNATKATDESIINSLEKK